MATTPAEREARLRDAISRAYYAAFILARNHLRDKESHSIPKTGEAHQYVAEQFESSIEPIRQSVADNLKKMRMYRRQADYVDTFPGLSGIANTALRLSEEVISNLSSL